MIFFSVVCFTLMLLNSQIFLIFHHRFDVRILDNILELRIVWTISFRLFRNFLLLVPILLVTYGSRSFELQLLQNMSTCIITRCSASLTGLMNDIPQSSPTATADRSHLLVIILRNIELILQLILARNFTSWRFFLLDFILHLDKRALNPQIVILRRLRSLNARIRRHRLHVHGITRVDGDMRKSETLLVLRLFLYIFIYRLIH